MISVRRVLLVFALLVLPGLGPANAVPVTWGFTGTIDVLQGHQPELDLLAALGVVDGASFTGTITYESDTPFSGNVNEGRFLNAILDAHFQIGAWSHVVDLTRETSIQFRDQTPGGTDIRNFTFAFRTVQSPYVQTSTLEYQHDFSMYFETESEAGPLPTDPAQLTNLTQTFGRLRENGCGECPVTGIDLNLQTVFLPEAGGLLLAVSAISPLLLRRRRHAAPGAE